VAADRGAAVWVQIGILPYAGVDIMTFEVLKEYLLDHYDGAPPPYCILGAGMVSSSIAQFASYPLALVRTRLQVCASVSVCLCLCRCLCLCALLARHPISLVAWPLPLALLFALYQLEKPGRGSVVCQKLERPSRVHEPCCGRIRQEICKSPLWASWGV
jgi:hypothetical protein